MRPHVIAYDVSGRAEGTASRRVFLAERVSTLSATCCRPLDAVWLVKSDRHVAEIRDNLAPYLSDGDKLSVFLVADACAWRGLAPDVGTWLQE